MQTISIINLKGGVGKTISAINIAYTLVALHGARVLLIDNDKQGNVSKFFNIHGDEVPGMAEIMTQRGVNLENIIKPTRYSLPGKTGLEVIPANMNLLSANREVLLDMNHPQHSRLKTALESVTGQYNYCVIDNAPDINWSVINALVVSHDVLVPIKVDKFAFDGLKQLVEQIEDIKGYNPVLRLAGCFITMETRHNVNTQGIKWLEDETEYPLFKTGIRKTVKVDETTFCGQPLLEYAKNSTAAKDYIKLVEEYLAL